MSSFISMQRLEQEQYLLDEVTEGAVQVLGRQVWRCHLALLQCNAAQALTLHHRLQMSNPAKEVKAQS